MKQINIKTNRYQELDALRGLAALMVVLFHFTMYRKEAMLGFKLGTTGVDLFFIISGFVIFMSLTKANNSKEFIINRISRLYPTYWACVTFTFILVIANSILKHKEVQFAQYIANMTMFQYYLKIPDIDGPYWTMIIEMIFYIAILSLFHFRLIKYLKLIGLTLTIAMVVIAFFINSIFLNFLIDKLPLLHFISLFFAGTIFYKIYTERKNTMENYCIISICLVCQILLFNYTGRSKRFISHNEYAVMLTFYFLLFTLFVNGKLKFIVSKASLFLGKISFALYLIHQKISINLIIPILVNKFNVNFWIASFFVALPIVIGLATIITFYIEIPLSKKMKEKLLAMSV